MTGGRDPWPDPLDGDDLSTPTDDRAEAPRDPEEVRTASTYRRRALRLILGVAGLAVLVRVGIVTAALTGSTEVTPPKIGYWVSSSAFFVSVPALLAWLLVRRGPRDTAMGRAMAGTTVALLLTSMVLGEGALCVMFAAPLVYAMAGLVVAVNRRWPPGGSLALAVLLVPVMQPTPQPQVHEVTVVRTVVDAPDDVADSILAGPDFQGLQRPWLLTLGYPVPDDVTRRVIGTEVEWNYRYGGGVSTFRMLPVPGGYEFEVVEDTAMTRWFRWEGATLRFEEDGQGTRVELTLRFDPSLGPDWYFGAIEGWFMAAAGEHLLDALGLEVAA